MAELTRETFIEIQTRLAQEATDRFLRKYKRHRKSRNELVGRTPELKLNPGIISCFFIISKISSSLAFTTFKIKFLLIFLKFEFIK